MLEGISFNHGQDSCHYVVMEINLIMLCNDTFPVFFSQRISKVSRLLVLFFAKERGHCLNFRTRKSEHFDIV